MSSDYCSFEPSGAKAAAIIERVSLPIHHVALQVGDPLAAARFYGEVLGLPEVRRLEDAEGRLRSIWLRAGSAVIMLEREIKVAGARGSGHVLELRVDDLARWERHLQGAGIAVADRTAATLFVLDPDGHRVGLSVYDLALEHPSPPAP
jgi:catechol 2,3-dioxygenase-like lactoylglutathione lyase family enzyme